MASSSNRPVFSSEDAAARDFDLHGHRGARGLAPENTIPAFRKALEVGVTTLEMDVVMTRDEKVVVSHEPWMSHEICTRPDGEPMSAEEEREHNLYELSYAEIEQYDCGQRRHPDFPEQEPEPAVKPLLSEVIAMAEAYVQDHDRPPVCFNVEVKSRPAWDERFHPPPLPFTRHVLDVIHEAGVAGRTTVQSFDVRVLRAVQVEEATRRDESRVGTALLVWAPAGSLVDQLEHLGFVPDGYGPTHEMVDEDLLQQAHDRRMRVVPWTVNERDDMRRLIRLGVDGLITDYPNVAQEVISAEVGRDD